MSEERQGLILTTLGVLILVPDATLIRVIEADSLTTALWRALLVGITTTVWFLIVHGRRFPAVVVAMGMPGVVVGGLWGRGTVLFVAAVDRTSVGNAVLIVATMPIWAAMLNRVVLGERLPRRTLLAMPMALLGVGIAFAGSIGNGTVAGDLFALAATITVAINFTILRKYSDRYLVPATALSGFATAAVLLAAGVDTSLEEGDLAPLLVLGIVVLPAAILLITAGAQRLPPPETSLLLLIETVLSPLFAAAVVGEDIPGATAIGGLIVVLTLAFHSVAAWREQPAPEIAAPDP